MSDDDDDDDDALSKVARKSNKGRGKQTKEAEESLMDHLERIEDDDSLAVQEIYSSDESVGEIRKVDAAPVSNEALLLEANKNAKLNLLDSSDSDDGKRHVAGRGRF